MSRLSASTEIQLADPERYLDPIAGHLGHHGAAVTGAGPERHLAFPEGVGTLSAASGTLTIQVEAATLPGLVALRTMLAAHVAEFAHEAVPRMRWRGDAEGVREPHDFRLMRVVATEAVGPQMRRIRLAGDDLARFDTDEHLHCKLLLPPQDVDVPEWPTLAGDGTIRWPAGDKSLTIRKYTIRRIDAAAGTLDIDFFLHGPAGPASLWAARAAPGDGVGMFGPGGRGGKPAAFQLLAGDETALPAIARMLEGLAPTTRGHALIEVASPSDEQAIEHRSDVEIRWLHRGGARPGTALLDAVAATPPPPTGTGRFAWAGAEFSAANAIRRHWRTGLGIARGDQLAVAYWREGRGGVADDEEPR